MPEAASLKTYRLFISHAWEYSDSYNNMVSLLDKAPRFQWSNHSLPEHDPADANNKAKLQEQMTNQISPVGVVLILAGMYANHSDWMEYEMDEADRLGKPIIGVEPWGQQKVPTEVQNRAREMVGWNTDSVVDAVRRHHS